MKSIRAVAVLQSILLGALTLPAFARNDMKPPEAGSLRVYVQRPKNVVHGPATIEQPGEYSCHYVITNVSKEPVVFSLYSCSVWDNWTTDSKEVFVKTGPCRANVLADQFLQPNDSFEGDVIVTASAPLKSGTRTFHLILTPCSTDREHPKQLNHFVSNVISLHLEMAHDKTANW